VLASERRVLFDIAERERHRKNRFLVNV